MEEKRLRSRCYHMRKGIGALMEEMKHDPQALGRNVRYQSESMNKRWDEMKELPSK